MARYPGLLLRILAANNPAMGPGRARLVALIAEAGSISSAAREMGMSYRRAWQLVEALNQSFKEPVVLTAVGGKRGGGAVVTEFGKRLVAQYHEMEAKASAAIAAELEEFSTHLRKPSSKRKPR
ncbi:MAG: LysR family transcriptional regulator [Betaproteobacteria bacterium RIFCSPLOWO2_02_FULL_67_26]|nr:MAG: LysR family transcriptional regulator [Betaproteobacteria bacterium RIFCSPLOWO2_02_FULL_67_26]